MEAFTDFCDIPLSSEWSQVWEVTRVMRVTRKNMFEERLGWGVDLGCGSRFII